MIGPVHQVKREAYRHAIWFGTLAFGLQCPKASPASAAFSKLTGHWRNLASKVWGVAGAGAPPPGVVFVGCRRAAAAANYEAASTTGGVPVSNVTGQARRGARNRNGQLRPSSACSTHRAA